MSEPTDRKISEAQHKMMLHCVGRKLRGHRNYYVAGDADRADWDDLVTRGLAKRESNGSEITGHSPVYVVTHEGFRLLFGRARDPVAEADELRCRVADLEGHIAALQRMLNERDNT